MNELTKHLQQQYHSYALEYGIAYDVVETIMEHVRIGRPMGHFCTALLSNDLMQTMNNADPKSLKTLHQIFKFVYNVIPGGSWGSPAKVKNWREHKIAELIATSNSEYSTHNERPLTGAFF